MSTLGAGDLTAAERRLCEAAAEGRLLDFSTGQADDDPSHGASWGTDRQVRAQLLYQLLSGRGQLDTAFGSPLAVRIQGAAILGPLELTLLTLRTPLELRTCHIDADLNFTKTTAPDLNLSGSFLSGGMAAGRFSVTHDLDLSRCICHQTIRLSGAHIGGQLDCTGAELRNEAGPALIAERLTVDGGLFLRGGFTATGELGAVHLPDAHISGILECHGATLTNKTGQILDLTAAATGPLFLAPDVTSETKWSIRLSGLTYQGIPAGASLQWWLTLLRHHTPGYAAQPWQQLAAVHRAAGHERDARRILIAQQDDRRRRLLRPEDDTRWRTRASLWTYRAYLGLLKLVVGYGYQTWRALIALLLILIAAAGLGLAAGHIHINPTQYVAGHTKATPTPGAPCSTVEQIGLGVDLGLPLIKTNVRARCDLDSTSRPGQAITAASWGLQVLSWGAATLVVAGYTGIVRRT